jgi:hypothetical protein
MLRCKSIDSRISKTWRQVIHRLFLLVPDIYFNVPRIAKNIFWGALAMDEREARLRGHEQNISHYKSILKTRLTDVEMRFLERRLAEERFKIAMLEFMSPSHIHSPRPKERVAP